jgi:hypothetical protein
MMAPDSSFQAIYNRRSVYGFAFYLIQVLDSKFVEGHQKLMKRDRVALQLNILLVPLESLVGSCSTHLCFTSVIKGSRINKIIIVKREMFQTSDFILTASLSNLDEKT